MDSGTTLDDFTSLKSSTSGAPDSDEEFPDLLSRIGLSRNTKAISAKASTVAYKSEIDVIDLELDDSPSTSNINGTPTNCSKVEQTGDVPLVGSVNVPSSSSNIIFDHGIISLDSDISSKPAIKRKRGLSKEEKEEAKRLKQEERVRKKEETAKLKELEKAEKQVVKEKQRMLNASACESFVTTIVDPSVLAIFDPLFTTCMNSYISQTKSEWKSDSVFVNLTNYVCWKRKLIDLEGGDRIEKSELASTVIMILPVAEFNQLINKGSNELITLIKQWKCSLPEHNITLAIIGNGGHSKKSMDALTDLQLNLCGTVQHRIVPNVQEFCQLLKNFHRAIALAPRKQLELAKAARELDGAIEKGSAFPDQSYSIESVVCDWWTKMLMQIPNVSCTIAQVVSSVYKSPSTLLEAYSQCTSDEEAKLLLKDLKVDRGDGRGKTSRKFGPEMSKRVHKMLTGTQGSTMLR